MRRIGAGGTSMEHEKSIIRGIEQELADVRGGRVDSHEDVMLEADAMLGALREALIEGEQSGEPRLVDFDALKDRMRKRRSRATAPAPPTARSRK